MTSEIDGAATAARDDRFARLKLGAALFCRAAVDAYVGILSRDSDFLASAQSSATLALELCMTTAAPACDSWCNSS